VWSRLARCDGDPRWPLGRQGARFATTCVGREFGSNAHNLQREKWCDAFARDSLTLADRLITEQNDRAWSLRSLIAKR
jgi:hypothetical protein